MGITVYEKLLQPIIITIILLSESESDPRMK